MNILAPVLIGAFFGYVTNPKDQTAPHVPVAVVDRDGSAVTKAIIDAMSKDVAQRHAARGRSAGARKLVSEGKLRAAIILPESSAQRPQPRFRRANAKDHHRRRPEHDGRCLWCRAC